MHPIVLRPTLVVLTLGMLAAALVQSAGRIGFAMLEDLQPAVNEWLAERGARVSGLSGDWRLLNPVLSIERLELPAGHLAGVHAEFDWLESLIRNRIVLRRLTVADASLVLEKDRAGAWRLAGSEGGGSFAADGLVYHGDELELAGELRFARVGEAPGEPVRVGYSAVNRGGVHRHRLRLNNSGADCAGPCELAADLEVREGLWPLQPERAQLRLQADRLRVPEPVLARGLLLESVDVRWHRRGDLSGGRAALMVADLLLPADRALSLELEVALAGVGEVHDGRVERLALDHDGETLHFDGLRVRTDGLLAEAWLDRLDLARAAGFTRRAFAGVDAARRWLGALDVRASALNLHAYLRLPTGEFGYAATLSDIALDPYKGVPLLRGVSGEVLGHANGVMIRVKGQDTVLQFPDTFHQIWQIPYVQGVVQGWYGSGYIGLRGLNLRAELPASRAAAGFSVSRPPDQYEQRVTLLIAVDQIALADARRYVPYQIPAELDDWLHDGPKAAELANVQFGYHGQVHLRPGELGRRVELTADVANGRVRYHPDWPEVYALDGRLAVAGREVRVDVRAGRSAGADLGGSTVILGDNAAHADLALDVRVPAAAALDFARGTPLAEWLTFVGPDWRGAGQLALGGDLHVPLTDQPEAALAVDLSVGFQRATLDMVDYRLTVTDLNGAARYRYPAELSAEGITGALFGQPLVVDARSADGVMTLELTGTAAYTDVLEVLQLPDPEVLRGAFPFGAVLDIPTDGERVTVLTVTSDLTGLAVDLPAGFRKTAAVPRPLTVSLSFLDDYQLLRFEHGTATGWLHVDETPRRGAIGFAGPAPVLDADADYVLLGGRLPGFALNEVVPDSGETGNLLAPFRLGALAVEHIDVEGFRVPDVVLNGDITADGVAVNLTSAMVAGDFRLDGDEPLLVNLERVHLPASADGSDPLSVEVIPELPEANVEIGSFIVGEEDYGRWSFDLAPQPDGLLIASLDAELRGVNILSADGVFWDAATNTSRFTGEVQAGDLAEVLPLWGYAASVTTRSAGLAGEFSWPGSPANFDIERLDGEAAIRAESGRFVDVEQGGGAVRIFSLMNFTAITKRMRGDFSDVTDKGLSFEQLEADVKLDNGVLEFVEPMTVQGTGSRFEVAGTVNLVDGTLDNDMIVTLPVSTGLPWYGLWVGIANPLAGAAILAGERVLRKPLEQFSSAKYTIGGTLDDPEVTLVSVFDTSMKEVSADAIQPPAELPETLPAPAEPVAPDAEPPGAAADTRDLSVAPGQPPQTAKTETDPNE